ncbi:CBS domain-containing protein [Desertifilum sp. FACHB-1129]|uniref:Phosphoribulokinase n=2 Tax=Desertifilum tharense IPPAS B-1220 TaxID=1781255 RepID=A0A1E5QER8_9CYAN|nr:MULTISPECIES: CBS domain-containing protein [Desertifilum]MDA0212899.1 CBS domain-containing protein [Cyanobacteria bacterium FC1]MBD2312533.1 CBS domain-containing protein [Desertifilum sp. FACHB-1129]MBD2323475.1 CBS domain-containing protein [Desertifilum sp. FACHB-866]MBD2333320.1 CBS domain-containing protein [Desertifilum sp. FACHB-868]OEJ73165.1 phosphoribulokinase [Desertifilum tharense IPPAS B-1220]
MPKLVADVMTRDPVVVNPKATLQQAINTLAEHRISGLPVVEEGKLIGVISESDLLWQETGVTPPPYIMLLDSVIFLQNPATYEKDLHKAMGLTVAEVMSDRPITIEVDRPLKDAAKLMHERNIRRLPVLDEAGTLVGILTRGDIIRSMVKA